MSQSFQPGDFLVFQLESGFALLRVLARDDANGDVVWHVAAYDEFFPDVEQAENAIGSGGLEPGYPHIALTNRAFESTQVAKLVNKPLEPYELSHLDAWRSSASHTVSDRSVRLMIGLR
jgi:hypothetical protein